MHAHTRVCSSALRIRVHTVMLDTLAYMLTAGVAWAETDLSTSLAAFSTADPTCFLKREERREAEGQVEKGTKEALVESDCCVQ